MHTYQLQRRFQTPVPLHHRLLPYCLSHNLQKQANRRSHRLQCADYTSHRPVHSHHHKHQPLVVCYRLQPFHSPHRRLYRSYRLWVHFHRLTSTVIYRHTIYGYRINASFYRVVKTRCGGQARPNYYTTIDLMSPLSITQFMPPRQKLNEPHNSSSHEENTNEQWQRLLQRTEQVDRSLPYPIQVHSTTTTDSALDYRPTQSLL